MENWTCLASFGFTGFAIMSSPVSSTTICLETFLMVVEMAKGKRHSIAVLGVGLLHKILREFCDVFTGIPAWTKAVFSLHLRR